MYIDLDIFSISNGFIIKLIVAIMVAIIMGIDRELKMKGIGVKTITVIVLASTMLTYGALEVAYTHTATQMRVVDPTRVPAYILSSLGFLGAGVILHKNNNVIEGLTTAAIVWAAAGLGILIGYEYYIEAIILSLFIVLMVNIMPFLLRILGPKKLRMRKMRITIEFNGEAQKIIEYLKSYGLKLGNIRVKDSENSERKHKITLTALIDEKKYVTDLYDYVKKLETVKAIDVEGL